MTDYSKMSDFEINKAVAISRHPELKDWICFDISGRAAFVINDGKLSRAQHGFSFTSCPSEAWPIILSNLIALKPVKLYVGGYRWFASKGDGDFGLKFADDNPLRAAMIVYLMMKESENA